MMKTILPFVLLLSVLLYGPVYPVAQAALPTLLLAPGARATGMGEAYVALSDDVYATYYNPGALGLNPLSNYWKSHRFPSDVTLVCIAAKNKLFFAEKPAIWAASQSGVFKYDG